MAVDEAGSFIGVTVTIKNKIRAVLFKKRDDVLAGEKQFLFGVGEMCAPGIRPLVHECHDPVGGACGQVVAQPVHHAVGSPWNVGDGCVGV